jgi:hypothetical protein
MVKRTILIQFASAIICSCSHYYYVSNVQNVPLFRSKSEYRAGGGYSLGDESQCVEVQAAYAAGNKVGVMGNFMTVWGGDASDHDYGKGVYLDGGIGYFKPVGEAMAFELYAGIGGSSQHHEYSGLGYSQGTLYGHTYGSSDLSFIKFFVQPAFGLRHNVIDIAVSGRISSVSYTNIGNYVYNNSYVYEELHQLGDKTHFFIEPAFTLRCGWKNLKLQFQGSYAAYLNNPKLYFGEEGHLSVGFYYSFLK